MDEVDLAREAEILSYQVLDAPELPALKQVADLAASVTGAAVAEVNLVTATEIHRIATSNDNAGTSVANELGFCARVIATADGSPHVIRDTSLDDHFRTNPFVTGPPRIKFYAGSTLQSPRGITFGTLCVYDSEPVEFTPEQAEVFERLAGLVTNILEQHKLEGELAGALRRLADSHDVLGRSNESLQAFAGQVSHDIRGPLTTIRLALEMAAEAEDIEERDFLVSRALGGVKRLGTTVQDVMDFALLGGRVEAQRVDLGTVMQEVLDDLSAVVGDARIEVGELPAVLAHEAQVKAVLQNLVSNAVKYSRPHANPEISVTAERVGASVRVRICDNGPGVPEERRTTIFGLMVRGENEVVEGHGIGLATCARIIRSYDGAVGVEEAPGGGAVFWFELPAA